MLVIELGRQRSPQALREALARTLRDPDLELLYWRRDDATFVDQAGRPATLPEVGSGRTSTILDNSGTPVAPRARLRGQRTTRADRSSRGGGYAGHRERTAADRDSRPAPGGAICVTVRNTPGHAGH